MAKVAVALGCEVAPIRLEEVGDVSYADLDDENATATVLVPKETALAASDSGIFTMDAFASGSASVSFDTRAVTVLPLRRVVA